MKSYYLAHPLNMRKEIREWELGFEKRTKINLFNPFYDADERRDIYLMDEGLIIPRTINSKLEGLKIVDRDLNQLEKQDGIICLINTQKESFGTPMELFYNSRILRRKSYIVTDKMEGHPWIKGLSTEIFKNKEDLEKYFIMENDI